MNSHTIHPFVPIKLKTFQWSSNNSTVIGPALNKSLKHNHTRSNYLKIQQLLLFPLLNLPTCTYLYTSTINLHVTCLVIDLHTVPSIHILVIMYLCDEGSKKQQHLTRIIHRTDTHDVWLKNGFVIVHNVMWLSL